MTCSQKPTQEKTSGGRLPEIKNDEKWPCLNIKKSENFQSRQSNLLH